MREVSFRSPANKLQLSLLAVPAVPAVQSHQLHQLLPEIPAVPSDRDLPLDRAVLVDRVWVLPLVPALHHASKHFLVDRP